MGFISPSAAISGAPLTAAQLDEYKAAVDAITNPARALLLQSASGTTSIASSGSTYTPVTFDTDVDDTASGWSSGSPSRYTCQTGWAGFYLLIGNLAWSAGAASGSRWVTFARNGAQVTGRLVGYAVCPTASSFGVQVVHEMFLNVGDYVEMHAIQSSGSTISTASTGLFATSLSVCWKAAA